MNKYSRSWRDMQQKKLVFQSDLDGYLCTALTFSTIIISILAILALFNA